ncbi:MAG: PspC domain-containing protein [Ferruginibacter sp.]
MKQVININFQGRVVPIEVSAYEMLKNYIDSLSRHFAAEEGRDEIINDIENRIGELFQERIKDGATCITDDDINAIIRNMGRPEDIEAEDASFATGIPNQGQSSSESRESAFTQPAGPKRLFRDENHKILGGVCSGVANYFGIDVVIVRIVFLILLFSFGIGFIPYIILWIAVPSTASTEIGSLRKKMYRDGDDKWIGGVCSGLAQYFGINVWIPRILFLIPFLSFAGRWGHWGRFGDFPDFISLGFSPGAMFIYIILWLVLPEATTTAEKLEMKGEKVDMNSIKNSVVEEMKGVHVRAQKFGKEAAAFAGERGKTFGAEAGSAAKKGSRSLGDIIIFLVKLFGYFILGTICFALVVALFVFGIMAIGVFPMKDYLLTEGWQNALAWGTLIFFIITPMIGVITWIIRRVAKIRNGSKMLRFGFSAMWILGWVCVTFLFASLAKDFRVSSAINEQEVYLSNPAVSSLELTTLTPGQRFSENRWFTMDPFEGPDEDSAMVRNVSVHIVQSPNDSFRVTMIKLACGRTKRFADTLASSINFNARQQDSSLIMDKGIVITKDNKFRNQRVIMTVYVPVGKQIKVHGNVGWSRDVKFDGPWSRDWENVEFENLEEGWDEGRWYTMTKDGLYTADGKPADAYKRERVNIDSDGIDINNGNQEVIINSNGIKIRVDREGENGTYRYENRAPQSKPDSVRVIPGNKEQRFKDSLKREKEKIDRLLNKTADNAGGTAAVMPAHDPMIFLN